jgi:putative hemin transport protein
MTLDELRKEVEARVAKSPGVMTMVLSRQLNAPEADVVRVYPGLAPVELDAARVREILVRLERQGKFVVIVSNDAATLEADGEFGGFSESGPFFNVQTENLDMHIRHAQIGSAFATAKLSHMEDGIDVHSFQFFDQNGKSGFKVYFNFGEKLTDDRQKLSDAIAAEFRKAA